MCGIIGLIGGGVSEVDARRMLYAQRHRGPDGEGLETMPGGKVILGQNRLAILDLSEAGSQPMWSHSGQTAITFNGEIYNYKELRHELRLGPARSGSDTEVLLEGFEKIGTAIFSKLIGMFAAVIFSRSDGSVTCVRDRLGIKPFLYNPQQTPDGNRVTIASEARTVLAGGAVAEPDMAVWSDYLVRGWSDHSDYTVFAGIHSLPPGHFMRISSDGTVGSPVTYWTIPNAVQQDETTEADAVEQFLWLLDDSISLRLRSDVPVGLTLSGGLDSSGMAATALKLSKSSDSARRSFTFRWGDPRYDEDDFADRAINDPRLERDIVTVSSADVADMLPEAIEAIEEPFGGVASLGYYRLMRQVQASGFKVCLEGQGLDELFGGYGTARAGALADYTASNGCTATNNLIASDPAFWSQWAQPAKLLRQHGRLNGIAYDGTRSVDGSLIDPTFPHDSSRAPQLEPPLPGLLNKVLFEDLRHFKLPRVLRMNDRLSMKHGIELREPFLDHRFVEFAFSLPAKFKIASGTAKWLPRKAFSKRLPEDVAYAPKRFVVSPNREWLAGPLRSLVEDVLNSQSFRERGWFQTAKCQETYRQLRAGKVQNGMLIWRLVNAELWLRQFVDRAHTA